LRKGRARRKNKLFSGFFHSSRRQIPKFRDLLHEISQSCEKNLAILMQPVNLPDKSPGHRNSKLITIEQKTPAMEKAES
jgi:hypothetical protein